MLTYVFRRLLMMLVTLFIVSVIGFVIVHSAPGSPFDPGLDPNANPAIADLKIEQYGLDKPMYYQFLDFYGKLHSDIGVLITDGMESQRFELFTYKTNEAVVPELIRRMLVTLPLFLLTTILTWTLAFPTGIYSAMHNGKPSDQGITILSYAMISLPAFWLALVVLQFLTVKLNIPVISPKTMGIELTGIQAFADRLWHVFVPSLLAALAGIALLSRYVKGQMLEVLGADFVRTAKAKGCDPVVINYKHALRNAALPFVTMVGGLLPALFSGSIIFESIFNWPGLGRWSFQAVLQRDYTIVLTTLYVSSALTLVGILISDLLYGVVDPRIRLS